MDVTREEAMGDERKDHTSAFQCGILELPLPLIFDILLRLPLRAILSSKCVCKTFLELFKDPYYSEDLLTKPRSLPTRLAIRQGYDDRSERCTVFLAKLFDLEGSSPLPERHAYVPPSYATPTIQYQFSSGDGVMLVGSCNGLLCLMPYFNNTPIDTYYICNPLLGEFIVIPPVTQAIPDYSYSNFSRFVFCPKSKQFKIVHFSGQQNNLRFEPPKPTVAEIYTLGSESWSSTGEVPSPVSPATLDSCLNGILHWVSHSDEASRLICSLDLDTEKFQYVSPPEHFDNDFLSNTDYRNVGVLNGCLCLCYYAFGDDSFQVWVMKDYGVAGSWTMEFYIDLAPYDKPDDLILPEDFFRLVSFLDNGDLLFQRYHEKRLLSYNRHTESFKWYKELRSAFLWVFPHVPSLISLKVIADGKYADSVKRIRKAGFGWTGFLDI